MVGSLVPPPTNPRSLTQLSSFLSHVNVRMKSASAKGYNSSHTNDAKNEITVFLINTNDKGIIHDVHLCQEKSVVPQAMSQHSLRMLSHK